MTVFRILLATLLAAVLSSTAAHAQGYPAKPIRFLVPFAAGGVGDLTARVYAQKMSESMGQQVIVDNRPSAGMIVSADVALKAEPDGYTMLLTGNGTAVSSSLFKALPYDILRDFTQVSTLAFFDLVLLVAPNSRYARLPDLLAYARANPGKLDLGTISIGSTQNLSAELFKSLAGIDAQIVPFKATPALVSALRAGDIGVLFEFIGPMMSQIKSGALKPLAVSAKKRSPLLPDVPTTAEGGLADFVVSSWNAVSVHAKTPRPIVERLAKEIAQAAADADVRQRMLQLGMEARATTPGETRELMASEIERWRGVIERAKIQKQ